MSQMPSDVEWFLPDDNTELDLHDLLKGYGDYWINQPSSSHYQRHFDTNAIIQISVYQLILWEGYPGSYDYYGDFPDEDHFYNDVMKGVSLFFHFTVAKDSSITMRVGSLYQRYASLSDLRHAMITEWPTIQPTLGEGGEERQQLITDYQLPVTDLLRYYGKKWIKTARAANARTLIHVADTYIYLVRWYGEADAIYKRDDVPPYDGSPGLHPQKIERYCEIRVGFKRVPVTFDLEQRRWNLKYRTTYYAHLTDSDRRSLDNFAALQRALAYVFRKLEFVEPPEWVT